MSTSLGEFDESQLNKDGLERLNKLKEYREKGLLTRKDFEKRVKELFANEIYLSSYTPPMSSSSEKPVEKTCSTPATVISNTVPAKAANKSDTVSSSTTSTAKATVQSIPADISEKSVPAKVDNKVSAKANDEVESKPYETVSSTSYEHLNLGAKEKEDLIKLEKLCKSGILTKKEFEAKRDQIFKNATPVSKPTSQTIAIQPRKSNDTSSNNDPEEQLQKLKRLWDKGILTEEEFNQKKMTILNSSSNVESAKPQKKEIPIYVNNQEKQAIQKTSTQIVAYITNVKASPTKPFQILLNGEAVMYTATEDVPPNKEVSIRGNIPHMSNEDLTVSLEVKMPERDIVVVKSFNLTKNGRFIQIGLNNDNQLVMKQQNTEMFEPIVPHLVPVSTPEQPKATGKTDIFLKVRGAKASKELPFEIYYMDKLLFSLIEDMPERQIGCITGQLLKERRYNAQTDDDHEVALKIKCPKVGILEATSILNLTRDGTKLFVQVEDNNLIVKQSISDESFDRDFRFVPMTITRSKEKELSQKDLELLNKLKSLLDAGILTEEEYEMKKNQIYN